MRLEACCKNAQYLAMAWQKVILRKYAPCESNNLFQVNGFDFMYQ